MGKEPLLSKPTHSERPCCHCGAVFTRTAAQARAGVARCLPCRRQQNFEYIQGRKAERRAYMDSYRATHREAIAATEKRRRETPEFKAKWAAYIAANADKKAARAALQGAVKAGRIARPSHCPQCGNDKHVEAHHDDYTKPLDVEWLCRKCHRKHHPTPSTRKAA